MQLNCLEEDSFKKHKSLVLPCGSVTIVDAEDFEMCKEVPWYKSEQGYVRGRLTNEEGVRERAVMMHRLLLNAPKGSYVDHVNGDRLDNRKENLRLCTKQENSWNRKPTKGSSKYKGIWFVKSRKKWRSCIRVNGKAMHLGYYETEEEAALAYNKAADKYFGEFAWLNNI